eukprot:TRINITY_DN27269_c0_g1_i2.p1 TRINITY_DN27269_c0_g1~~TRINITY_DN27269_c0_g1_i2.p1  ORF type:complete len:271 (+),score=36.83 TRINITY_DN27269_c0_g1_i2:52-813(+)
MAEACVKNMTSNDQQDVRESLSVEETNKLRISLGLKPLHAEPAPAPPLAPQPDEQVCESLTVDATNALRLKLGLRPLHGTTPPPPAQDTQDAPHVPDATAPQDDDVKVSLSVSETNALREKLGLKPLHTSDGPDDGQPSVERTAADEIFDPESVKVGVSKLTANLKLDPRIGTGHVRASSMWDDSYLSEKQGSGYQGGAGLAASHERLMLGSSTVIVPDFYAGKWNAHLSIPATNTLREKLGLRPLYPLSGAA